MDDEQASDREALHVQLVTLLAALDEAEDDDRPDEHLASLRRQIAETEAQLGKN